jgi:hypothetical protein
MVDSRRMGTWQALWIIGSSLPANAKPWGTYGEMLGDVLLLGAAVECWRLVQALEWLPSTGHELDEVPSGIATERP